MFTGTKGDKMIDIIYCPNCGRLKLEIGEKYLHISWKEARHLLKRLKEHRVERRNGKTKKSYIK